MEVAPCGGERVGKNTSRYAVAAEARYSKLHFPIMVECLGDQFGGAEPTDG